MITSNPMKAGRRGLMERSLANTVVVVSGLPRSGTSLMMQVLQAGGLPLLTDRIRTADEDNPKGYYEYEPVKQLASDAAWLMEARGKAVKIVAQLLPHLPDNPDFDYRVLFMDRALPEVIASQNAMLKRRNVDGAGVGVSDQQMMDIFARQVAGIKHMLAERAIPTLVAPHREMIQNPEQMVRRINHFLDGGLKAGNMAAVIDKGLHRQREKS